MHLHGNRPSFVYFSTVDEGFSRKGTAKLRLIRIYMLLAETRTVLQLPKRVPLNWHAEVSRASTCSESFATN